MRYPLIFLRSVLSFSGLTGAEVQYEATYDRGHKVGIETLYRPDGSKAWAWSRQPAGNSTWTGWWSNARKKAESTRRGVRCHGVARCWDGNGRLISEVDFEDGHPVSP